MEEPDEDSSGSYALFSQPPPPGATVLPLYVKKKELFFKKSRTNILSIFRATETLVQISIVPSLISDIISGASSGIQIYVCHCIRSILMVPGYQSQQIHLKIHRCHLLTSQDFMGANHPQHLSYLGLFCHFLRNYFAIVNYWISPVIFTYQCLRIHP